MAGEMLPKEQNNLCAGGCASVMVHVPGPLYGGLIDQLIFVPVGSGSLSVVFVAVPVPAAGLLLIVTVYPMGLPAFTTVSSATLVTLKLGGAMVSGKATTTSLNCLVFPPIPASGG